VFHAGRPIETAPGWIGAPGSIRYSMQPTVVSVGPYSLITVAVGWVARQVSRTSPSSCSPPSTRSPVGDMVSGRALSSARWLGVALRKVHGCVVSASWSGCWSVNSVSWMRPPTSNGP
jgi:hypothetical protein